MTKAFALFVKFMNLARPHSCRKLAREDITLGKDLAMKLVIKKVQRCDMITSNLL